MLGIISHDPTNPICPHCGKRPMWLTLGMCPECWEADMFLRPSYLPDHDHLCASCGLSPHIEADGTCAECRTPAGV